MSNLGEVVLGKEGVGIESAFIPLFAAVIFGIDLGNNFDLIFQGSFIVLILFLIIRLAANQADDPDLNAIKKTITYGSRLFQITLIGTIATLSIHIYATFSILSPEQLFGIIGISLALTIGIVDQLILGEYVRTWENIVREQTGDNVVGKALRYVADISLEGTEKAQKEESNLSAGDYLRGLLVGILLLILLIGLTFPVSFLFHQFLGNIGVSILILLSLIVLRDVPRYIYIRYGASPPFSDLKRSTGFELGWIALLGILVAGALGYDLLSYII